MSFGTQGLIAVVQGFTSSITDTVNCSSSLNVQAGDLLVATLSWQNAESGNTITVDGSDGSQTFAAGPIGVNSDDIGGAINYLLSASADATFTPRMTVSASSRRLSIIVRQYRPDSGETVSVDATASVKIGSGTAITTNTLSTTGTDVIAVACASHANGGGFNTDSQIDSTNSDGLTQDSFNAAWYRFLTSTISGADATITVSGSEIWVSNFIAFKSEAGGDIEVLATTDAITLTTYSATITLGADINVNASVSSLVLTEYPATINVETSIQAGVDALTLSEYPATINSGTNVLAGVDALILTEHQATVNAETSISVGVDTLTLTTYGATINLEVAGIAYIQGWYNDPGSGDGTLSVSFQSNVVAGNLIVVMVSDSNGQIDSGGVTTTLGSQTFTIDESIVSDAGHSTMMYHLNNDTSGSMTVDIDITGGTFIRVQILEYSGLVGPAHKVSSAQDFANNPAPFIADPGTVITTIEDCTLIMVARTDTVHGDFVLSNGFILRDDSPGGDSVPDKSALGDQIDVAIGEWGGDVRWGSSDDWSALLVAYPPESAAGDTNVNAAVDALTLTKYPATVNAETSIQAAVDAFTLTTYPATVTLRVEINANVDVLTLTEYPATVNAAKNIQTSVDVLTLTEYQATVNAARNVAAGVDSMTLSEYAATITLDRNIAASVHALTLVEYSATVSATATKEVNRWSTLPNVDGNWTIYDRTSDSWTKLKGAEYE